MLMVEVIVMRQGRRESAAKRKRNNPYYEEEKYAEPTVCPQCGLVYRDGRWQSSKNSSEQAVGSSTCPACRREADHYPAGLVTLEGAYLEQHKTEILNIIRNQATLAKKRRPLQRIMWVKEQNGAVEIATTSDHLALRIGKAVEHACSGNLTTNEKEDVPITRVDWNRN